MGHREVATLSLPLTVGFLKTANRSVRHEHSWKEQIQKEHTARQVPEDCDGDKGARQAVYPQLFPLVPYSTLRKKKVLLILIFRHSYTRCHVKYR